MNASLFAAAAAQSIFGLTVFEAIAVVAAVGYVIAQIKDWRPVKELRRENGELRQALADALDRVAGLEAKVSDLERASVPVLEQQLAEVARELGRVVSTLDRLDGSVKASVAAVEVLSKRSIIDAALADHDAH